MGDNQLQVGEIHNHVVQRHWVAVFVARAGEDGSTGVHHQRHAILDAFLVNRGQAAQIRVVKICVDVKMLVRRVQLDAAQPEAGRRLAQQPVHLRGHVSHTARVNAPEREQPLRICARGSGGEIVGFFGEADNIWADVVDDDKFLHAAGIHVINQAGRVTINGAHLLEILTVRHERSRARKHLLPRHDVHVRVDDPIRGTRHLAVQLPR